MSIFDVKMSPIVSISEEVRRLGARFKFQRGEVDFDTPSHVVQAAQEALANGMTKYPKSGGEGFFKQAVINRLERDFGVTSLDEQNVVCTHGGQEALQLLFSMYGEGTGFSPTWSCALNNFVPYAENRFNTVPLNEDFTVNWEAVEDALFPGGFFYFNNPHNPTGKVFTKEEVDRLVDICTAEDVHIISDEAYEHFVYDGLEHVSLVGYEQPNITAVFTCSKSYAMTGWRIGYAVTRNKTVSELLRLGNYTQTAGVAPFIQQGAAAALSTQSDEILAERLALFEGRRDALYEALQGLPGMTINRPQGAFYLFPRFNEPAQAKLMKHGIATIPGGCFGSTDQYIRLSFSTTDIGLIQESAPVFRQALD